MKRAEGEEETKQSTAASKAHGAGGVGMVLEGTRDNDHTSELSEYGAQGLERCSSWITRGGLKTPCGGTSSSLSSEDAGAAVEQECTRGAGVPQNAEWIRGDHMQNSNGIYYRARKRDY